MTSDLLAHAPYLLTVVLASLGVYSMIAHRDYLKVLVGLILLQSSIILFFILLSVRTGGTVPVLSSEGQEAPAAALTHNPLPHALMLTAIVVGVATQGLAIAILRCLRVEEGTTRDTPRPIAGAPKAPAQGEVR